MPRRPQIARRAPDRTSTAPSAQSEVNFRLTPSKRTPVDRAQRASKLRSRVAQLQRKPLVLNRAAQAADLRLSDTPSQPLVVERAQKARKFEPQVRQWQPLAVDRCQRASMLRPCPTPPRPFAIERTQRRSELRPRLTPSLQISVAHGRRECEFEPNTAPPQSAKAGSDQLASSSHQASKRSGWTAAPRRTIPRHEYFRLSRWPFHQPLGDFLPVASDHPRAPTTNSMFMTPTPPSSVDNYSPFRQAEQAKLADLRVTKSRPPDRTRTRPPRDKCQFAHTHSDVPTLYLRATTN